ncbi:MAG: hypothetical protein KGY76_09335 [Candidatus Thermoplasmatota archaeon]|nr:hypothetical protein [Candidatus Thermoplasmatota archaeon]
MPYSIPSEEEIEKALRYVMRRTRGVGSLQKLRDLVIGELQNNDPEYTVSSERLRKIAVTAPFINTEIDARKGEKKKDLKGRCPVCGSDLEKTKNETIFGGSVTLGYKCEECPYWTTLKRRIPTQYNFEYKKEEKIDEDKA